MVLCNTALCQIDQNSPVMRLTAKERIFLAQVAGVIGAEQLEL